MSTLAIAFNDAALSVADASGVLAEEPGYALAGEQGLLTGEAALRRARLQPRQVYSRHWSELSTSALSIPFVESQSAADLAFQQLSALWRRCSRRGDEALLALPGSFDAEQVSLLLGIAGACEIEVAGIVDAAAVAPRQAHPGWDVFHVELHLHAVGLTRLDDDDGVVARSYERILDQGLHQLRERWARKIRELFLSSTRFDPFSAGETEQRLYDALPACAASLLAGAATSIVLDAGGVERSVEVRREDLSNAVADLGAGITRRIDAARTHGRGVVIHVGEVMARQPGMLATLRRVPGVELVVGSQGTVEATLQREDEIRRRGDRFTRVTRLDWLVEPRYLDPPRLRGAAQAGPSPSHIVFQGLAHGVPAIGIGAQRKPGGELLVGVPVDAAELVFRPEADQLRLERRADARVQVNGLVAVDPIRLAPGDEVRLEAVRDPVHVIALLDSDGA